MQMTLRQAHKLVEKITARLATVNISPTREVNIWNADGNTFDKEVSAFSDNLERAIDLMQTRHAIRQQIGAANFAEVNSLIAQRKLLLDRLGILRTIIASAATSHLCTSAESLRLKVAALAQGAASGGRHAYGEDTVTVMVVDADDVNLFGSMIDQFQLQVEEVEDKLTAANSNREHVVSLSDDDITLLRQESVLPK